LNFHSPMKKTHPVARVGFELFKFELARPARD
jgi:hypothetical protein